MDKTRKSKKLYYSYKISLQWISTNYKLQYEYGFDIKLRNKIRFHLSSNGQRHYISLKNDYK